jgi:hypothetical protein
MDRLDGMDLMNPVNRKHPITKSEQAIPLPSGVHILQLVHCVHLVHPSSSLPQSARRKKPQTGALTPVRCLKIKFK